MGKSKKIKSPCNSNCKMSKKSGLCKGCKRTIDEIEHWGKFSNKERKKLLTEILTR
ncbi:MAG: DUF1289 domain-containing protein [Calditrichaeota bacterium]|nr:MAG: DUF1289 domain-containing protein [Calditrichota bacterium]MBL1206600.1 DUF1289 domain-containing protein [Calditrichota bacterium]NOG46427.1 DUF1289 domain-containing protein [Calditrichota bacterium]